MHQVSAGGSSVPSPSECQSKREHIDGSKQQNFGKIGGEENASPAEGMLIKWLWVHIELGRDESKKGCRLGE